MAEREKTKAEAQQNQARRLRSWRRSLDLTQAELANMAGLNPVTYGSYEQKRPIPIDVLARLRTLGYDDSQGNATVVRESTVSVNFGGRAFIRSWRGAMAGFKDDIGCIEADGLGEVPAAFLVDPTKPDRHDLVRVSGRSMEPRVHSGDQVVIFRDTTLFRNSIVLATAPDGRTFLKVLREGQTGKWELHSLSADGAVFDDLRDWMVHGYAVAIIQADPLPGTANVEFGFGRPLKA